MRLVLTAPTSAGMIRVEPWAPEGRAEPGQVKLGALAAQHEVRLTVKLLSTE